ncbi:alginate export family protein [Aestuariibacter salexigens]|uniref:alginate export family protein n=1 Tax=Aestuariibacter salexigens TaxID=226010 RepID=UPI000479C05F|nr:alginate export family protein [Aestuariibacter salexigens]
MSWNLLCKCLLLAAVSVISAFQFNAKAASPEFDWSGSWRLRFESLNRPIFPVAPGTRNQHNQRLSSVLFVKGQVTMDNWNFTLEMQDARAWLDNDDPTLTSSQINTFEPVNLFVRYSPQDSVLKSVTVGRVALDHGSRRLLAKAVYRNAINSFQGIMADWQSDDVQIRTFYLQPLSRLPTDRALIDNNERAFDKGFSERRIFGVYANTVDNMWRVHSYWLKEDDAPGLATRNRNIFTMGFEYTDTIMEDWLANIEMIGQQGRARQTTSASDTEDLDQRGWLIHGSLGQQILGHTVLRAEIDLVSGDNDASDDTIRNFDHLYGVRRFDYGPTDVYQALPRRNFVAVGARSVSKFTPKHNLMLSYKSFWYQKRPDGIDNFIGNQVEARLRWQATKAVRLELGGAVLFKGEGFERGAYPDDSLYGYTALKYTF